MRLGVLDVGSNTVHLLVVDAHPGAHPLPMHSDKSELRLAELLDDTGALRAEGADSLVEAAARAAKAVEEHDVEDLMAFATSAVRDATNSAAVLARVRDETGVDLLTLSGEDESRLTFLAARRWFGWSAGRLLSLDIGGGSLEMAIGIDEDPDVAVSVPLGAGRLTRERLAGDPPAAEDVEALRSYAVATLEPVVPELTAGGSPDRVVGSSKTFRSLARLAGAAPYKDGPRVRRQLRLDDLREQLERIAPMTAAERGTLGGVSPSRAQQLLAGGVVAEVTMGLLGVDVVEICPWALREGVILRRLDWLAAAGQFDLDADFRR